LSDDGGDVQFSYCLFHHCCCGGDDDWSYCSPMSRDDGDGGDAPPLFLLTLVMVNYFQ
jgi:hypothetical protein